MKTERRSSHMTMLVKTVTILLPGTSTLSLLSMIIRSTQCFACCAGRQRTPSACSQMTPGSLPLSSRTQNGPPIKCSLKDIHYVTGASTVGMHQHNTASGYWAEANAGYRYRRISPHTKNPVPRVIF